MPRDINFVTFNIRYGTADDGPDSWQSRADRCASQIRELQPDVLCVQEALRLQVNYLLERFPEFDFAGVGRDDGEAEGEHAGILSRRDRLRVVESGTFWLSDTPEIPGSADWGDSNVRVCTWAHFQTIDESREFSVFNTHLAVASQLAREKGVELILERVVSIGGERPTIVAGDFNADETNPGCEQMRQAGFRDSYRHIHPTGSAPTYNGFVDSPEPGKIDYIWATQEVEVNGAEVVRQKFDGRWPSDHFPVTARLSISGRRRC